MGKQKGKKPAEKTARKPAGKAAKPAIRGARARKGAVARATATEKREMLVEELQEAIGQIDEDGLAFLLNQAHVLIHNAQVQRINTELAEPPIPSRMFDWTATQEGDRKSVV